MKIPVLLNLIQKKSSRVIAIILLSLSITAAFLAFLKGYNNTLRKQKSIELTAVTKMKTRDISIWYTYRLKDAVSLSQNRYLIGEIESYLKDNNKHNKEIVLNHLNSFKQERDYKDIILSFKNAQILSTNDSVSFESELKESIRVSAASEKPLSTDIYICGLHSERHIDFISPIFDESKKVIAILAVRADPEEFLFPFIRSWPVETKRNIALLMRTENDSLVFLSSVQPGPNQNRFVKTTISSLNLPKGANVNNYSGLTKLTNPNNKRELAFFTNIPETPWFLVTIIVKEDLFKDYGSTFLIIILAVFSFLLFLSGTGFIYVLYQRNLYLKLYLSQEEFRTTLYSIGDGVITTDKYGKVRTLNHIAEGITGYSEKEAKGKHLDDIFMLINEDTRSKVKNPAQKVLKEGRIIGLANHTLLIAKDGHETPIADSGAPIKDTKGNIIGVVIVFSDQSSEREKQRVIEENEKKYRQLFTSTTNGICLFKVLNDNEGNPVDYIFLDANPSFELISGISRELIIGKKASEISLMGRGALFGNMLSIVTSGTNESFEQYDPIIRKHLLITVYAHAPGIFVVVMQDISKAKVAEIRQKCLYKIAGSMLTSSNLSELAEIIIHEIRTATDSTGLSVELYGKVTNLTPVISLDTSNDIIYKDKPAEKSLQSYTLEKKKILLLKEDEIIRLQEAGELSMDIPKIKSCICIPLFNKKLPSAVLSVFNDQFTDAFDDSIQDFLEIIISQTRTFIDRKLIEDEIGKLSMGIVQSPVGIVFTDLEGDIEYANPKYLQMTGYNSEEITGKHFSNFISDYHPKEFYNNLWATVKSGKDWQAEVCGTRKTGENLWENVHISPIIGNNGRIAHFISIWEDTTEKKEMVEHLIKAKENAEESDRLKTLFLANMSHEVRTPMNAIVGFSELLGFDNVKREEQIEYTDIIKQRSYELLAILDDIIDVSRLESGKLKLFPVNINIRELLKDIYTTANNVWCVSGKSSVSLELVENIYEDDIYIFTDSGRLKQILTNLIDNAFKFTEKGSIRFGYKEGSDNQLIFYVIDSGIGISEEKQEIIFERFRQVEEDYTRKQGGIGLGLSICKGLVELLGGKIWVESTPGKGSSFFFTISKGDINEVKPLKKKKILSLELNNIWKNRNLLLVEDEMLNAKYILNALAPTGINIIHKVNGNDAVNLIKEGKHHFDLVLLDIRLPDIDGLDLAREMKIINNELPIIAQTAYASEQYRKKSMDAGCNEYIAKPFKVHDLISLIMNFI
jgi:PAS domain S-box-containing protein